MRLPLMLKDPGFLGSSDPCLKEWSKGFHGALEMLPIGSLSICSQAMFVGGTSKRLTEHAVIGKDFSTGNEEPNVLWGIAANPCIFPEGPHSDKSTVNVFLQIISTCYNTKL